MMALDLTELRLRDQRCVQEIIAARDAMFGELSAFPKGSDTADPETISRFLTADRRFRVAIDAHDVVIDELKRALAEQR